MNAETKMSDITRFGEIKDIAKNIMMALDNVDKYILLLENKINENELQNRTEKNVVLLNLSKKLRMYLFFLNESLLYPEEIIAYYTRCLFELNLITRYIIQDEKNLKSFTAEFVQDKIDIFEGIKTLANDTSSSSINVLNDEIQKLRDICSNRNLVLKKPETIRNIAKTVGQDSEYVALYKLFSKYTHPTSYSINIKSEDADLGARNTFYIHAQLYAFDMFERIKNIVDVI